MKKSQIMMLAICLSLCAAPAFAGDRGTVEEAKAMVKKAVALIQAKGEKEACDEINKGGPFLDRDLYITITDMSGVATASSFNPKMVGKDLKDMADVDGKPFVKERLEMAKTKKSFSQEYKFTDPVTKKTMGKEAFCDVIGEAIICSAVYK